MEYREGEMVEMQMACYIILRFSDRIVRSEFKEFWEREVISDSGLFLGLWVIF